MRRLPALALAATIFAASACGSANTVDLDPVNEAIGAIESAQTDLRTRMSDIEGSLSTIGTTNGDPEAAAELLAQLDSLTELMTTLEASLAQLTIDSTDADTELRDLLAGLESTLAGVTTSLSSIRGDVSQLREDQELLKQRFERHLQDANG